MELRVGTYNIQHGVDQNLPEGAGTDINLQYIVDFIRERNLDICGLNEVGMGGLQAEQAKVIAEQLGYDYRFGCAEIGVSCVGKDGQYGNAIISRYPIVNSRNVLIEAEKESDRNPDLDNYGYYENRALLIAEIDVNGCMVTAMSCHIGFGEYQKNLAVETILEESAKVTTPLFVMGDFNFTSDTKYYHSLAEKLIDTESVMVGGAEEHFTFPSAKGKPLTSKIDYIFVKPNSDCLPVSAEAVAYDYSDHRPLMACFELKF